MRSGPHALAGLAVLSLAFVSLTRGDASAAASNSDADAKIIETVRPQFPIHLQRMGIANGEVSLLLEIDPKGRLIDCLVTAYTRSDFSREALRVANLWRFEPARIDGKPVNAVVPLTIAFE